MKLHGFGVAERQNEGSTGSVFGADRTATDLARCFLRLICPATRSTGLAGMKQSLGARPARSCLLSMRWIVASLKREYAASALVTRNACRSMDAPTIELPDPIHLTERRRRLCADAPFHNAPWRHEAVCRGCALEMSSSQMRSQKTAIKSVHVRNSRCT